MKLKTTIYGKSSTLVGTPDEISALLDAVRRTARQRAIDSLPRIIAAGERLASKPAPKEPVHAFIDKYEVSVAPFKPTFEPIAQTREEIVNEAIADVAELSASNFLDTDGEVFKHVGDGVCFDMKTEPDHVDFHVNRNIRTVVAILRLNQVSTFATKPLKPGKVATTGIARCAPSDVFNEHVGKAIALRRALGLPVPAKYYEVGGIAPEGKQVGDVVKFNGVGKNVYQTVLTDDFTSVGGPWSGKTMIGSVYGDKSKVIDDSARYVAPSTPAAKVVYVGE